MSRRLEEAFQHSAISHVFYGKSLIIRGPAVSLTYLPLLSLVTHKWSQARDRETPGGGSRGPPHCISSSIYMCMATTPRLFLFFYKDKQIISLCQKVISSSLLRLLLLTLLRRSSAVINSNCLPINGYLLNSSPAPIKSHPHHLPPSL